MECLKNESRPANKAKAAIESHQFDYNKLTRRNQNGKCNYCISYDT